MAKPGMAKVKTKKAVTPDITLKPSGRGYLIVWDGKDAGLFTPLHEGNFSNCVNGIRNALRAYNKQ